MSPTTSKTTFFFIYLCNSCLHYLVHISWNSSGQRYWATTLHQLYWRCPFAEWCNSTCHICIRHRISIKILLHWTCWILFTRGYITGRLRQIVKDRQMSCLCFTVIRINQLLLTKQFFSAKNPQNNLAYTSRNVLHSTPISSITANNWVSECATNFGCFVIDLPRRSQTSIYCTSLIFAHFGHMHC